MTARRGKRRKNLNGSLTLAGFLVIVGLAAGVIFNNTKDLKAREQTYILREQALEADIADEEARRKTLEERKKYVTTDRYIKEVAKERLGLLDPDEVLLKENEN